MTLATAARIHPTHLADLRKSGLSDATIAHNSIHTANPQELQQLAGVRVPAGRAGWCSRTGPISAA